MRSSCPPWVCPEAVEETSLTSFSFRVGGIWNRYSAPLYVDMKKTVFSAPSDEDPIEADWEELGDEFEESKIYIGKVHSFSLSLSLLPNDSQLEMGGN